MKEVALEFGLEGWLRCKLSKDKGQQSEQTPEE